MANTKQKPQAKLREQTLTKPEQVQSFPVEIVRLDSLKPHPRNYLSHPDDQLHHLIKSIEQHGLYRNVVIAKEGTILAGHGVTQALGKMGWEELPVIRLPIAPDSPQALKLLAGDNSISHLAEVDDRLFTEILKDIRDLDDFGLLGTGYDDAMLANLLFVTRPESEIQDLDEAAHWVGMPEYEDSSGKPLQIIISFRNEQDRDRFVRQTQLAIGKRESRTWMTWWPVKDRDDLASLRFDQEEAQAVQ
jgi:hypothetical protein